MMLKGQNLKNITLIKKLISGCKIQDSNIHSYANPSVLKKITNTGPRGWILLFVPVASFGLGTWQVQRRKWKLNLIQDLEKRINSTPIPFPEDISELEKIEYHPIVVKGEFDHSKEMFLGPRSFIKNGDAATESSLLMDSKSNSGYCVITPFHLSDKNATILINRGWVPRHQRSAATRSAGQVEGEVQLVGVLRHSEKRRPFTPENKGDLWFYRDLPNMAKVAGCLPVLLEATFESSAEGGPIGGQTRVTLHNQHLSYIVTWYSLSAVTLYMWFKMFVTR